MALSLARAWGVRRLVAVAAWACAVLATPPAAHAQVGVGHSGWYWGNPLPQGNTLSAVELGGGAAYAAGAFGTLLRSDDGGFTWSGLATGITADLNRVEVIDANSVVVGGGCALRRSDDGGESFRRLPFTPREVGCPSPLRAFSFPSASVAYLLLESGTILRTTDGGETFTERALVPGTGAGGSTEVAEVAFNGADTGIAVSASGAVHRTSDGAATWTYVAGAPRALNGVRFATATVAYAVGDDGVLLRSDDGGRSWALRPLTGAPPSDLARIRCAATERCLISTETGERMLRTTDGGAAAAETSSPAGKLFAATLGANGRAIAVGENGSSAVSNDSGTTFSPTGGRLTGLFNRVRAASPSTAYATGDDGLLARTTDAGRSWTDLTAPSPHRVLDVAFPTPDAGFALDFARTAFRTNDGGRSWQPLDTGGAGRLRVLVALDTRRVLLIGVRGVRLSRNGGASFATVRSPAVHPQILNDADRVGNHVFAWAPTRLVYSANGGRTWHRLRRPPGRTIRSVDFVTSRLGYLARSDGRVFRTRNRGRTWRELPALAAEATRIAFPSARHGFAATADYLDAGGGGFALRTSDGGRTWRPQLVSPVNLESIAARGRTTFGLAGTIDLLATSTGGDLGRVSTLRIGASRRTLRRAGRVRVSGRLTPAEGGEIVRVAMRDRGPWSFRTAEVAPSGAFSTTWRVRRSSVFVAQWHGDDDRAGAGTGALRVRVRRR